MLFRFLPLIAGLLPIAGVTAAYWLGSVNGVLPDCIPYIDGCTSISSTGRHMPGSLPFRATLFPQAAFLLFLWWYASSWLQAVARPRYSTPLFVSGAIGAIALILYVTFLGTEAPFYEFMRRFGIYFYFLGTAVAQLLFSLALDASRPRTLMLAVALGPWVIGILNLVQKEVLAQPNNIENRIEWWAALLMQAWFVMLYFYWRGSDHRASVSTDSSVSETRNASRSERS